MSVNYYSDNTTPFNGGMSPCSRPGCPGPTLTGRWDPKRLLEFMNPDTPGGPKVTCMGVAKSTSKRCQFDIAPEATEEALDLLNGLNVLPADQAIADPTFEEAVSLSLCPYHPKQAAGIKRRWGDKVTVWCRDHRRVHDDGASSVAESVVFPPALIERVLEGLLAHHSFDTTSYSASAVAPDELPSGNNNNAHDGSATSSSTLVAPVSPIEPHQPAMFGALGLGATGGTSITIPRPPPPSVATTTSLPQRIVSRQSEAPAPATQLSRDAEKMLVHVAPARLPTPPAEVVLLEQGPPVSDISVAGRGGDTPPSPPASPSSRQEGHPAAVADEVHLLRESNARLGVLLAQAAAQLAENERLCAALESTAVGGSLKVDNTGDDDKGALEGGVWHATVSQARLEPEPARKPARRSWWAWFGLGGGNPSSLTGARTGSEMGEKGI